MTIHRVKTKFKTEWEGSYPVKRIFSDPFSFSTMGDKNPWNGYRKPSFHILNLSNIQM